MANNPFYEAVIVSRTPAQSRNDGPTLELIDRVISYKNISWSEELVGDGSGSISCSADSITDPVKEKFENLAENPCELWIYRNDRIVHAGPVIGIQLQGKRKTITIHSRGMLYYLKYMFIQFDYDQSRVGKPILDIIHWLINQWTFGPTRQAPDNYANFGFRISPFGKTTEYLTTEGRGSTTNIALPHLKKDGKQILRKVLYKANDLRNVREELDLLANNEDGFDYWMDYNQYVSNNGMLQFGPNSRTPVKVKGGYVDGVQEVRGSDKSSFVAIEARNIHNSRLWSSVAKDDIATWVKVVTTSSKQPPRSYVSTNELKSSFGKVGKVSAIDGTLDLPKTFSDKLAESLGKYQVGLSGQQEGTSLFSFEGASPDDFGAGDIISFIYDAGYTLINIKREVAKLWVSTDEGGTEKMTVEFS